MRARSALPTRETTHGDPGSLRPKTAEDRGHAAALLHRQVSVRRSATRGIRRPGNLRTLTRRPGPKPSWLGTELRRLAPQLGIHGILVKVSRCHQGRVVSLARVRTVSDYNADTP
jgi:hypothetical protein